MLLVGWAFSGLWLVLTRDTAGEGLLHASLDRAAHRAAIRRFGLASVAYLATVGLSFVTPIGTLALHAALARAGAEAKHAYGRRGARVRWEQRRGEVDHFRSGGSRC